MKSNPPINWVQQWETFAPGFTKGLAHIDLSNFGGKTLLLQPGAGFGDFSHPTTRLTLQLMAPLVKNKIVIDIGCGSGILSLAALLLGAKQAYGIDVDCEAVIHSKENAILNKMESKADFAQDLNPCWELNDNLVIVMNMISTEQKNAWEHLFPLHSKQAKIVTSGLLCFQKNNYLLLTKRWGWDLLLEKEEEGWLGCVFKKGSLLSKTSGALHTH